MSELSKVDETIRELEEHVARQDERRRIRSELSRHDEIAARCPSPGIQ
jgi:hypothetical protein